MLYKKNEVYELEKTLSEAYDAKNQFQDALNSLKTAHKIIKKPPFDHKYKL